MTGIVGRTRRSRDGAGHHANENQNENTPRTASTSRKAKARRKHPPTSPGNRGTPVVIPPWSYSLREVKEKVHKRDGMRRRPVDQEELAIGDVEGVWKAASGDDAASIASGRFLPTAREEERLDRMFESYGAGPDGQQNIPFGRGSYRAKKSMGERRWEALLKQEVQNGIDHVETLEERFGKRFVRECRRRVYGGIGIDGRRTGKEPQVEERTNENDPQTQGCPRPRLNVGVPVGRLTQKRPSTADASIKRSRVEAAEAATEEGRGDGWRIEAGRPSSH